MINKERLYVKLVIFSLERVREFILGHYDEATAISVSSRYSARKEDYHMFGFCFRSLDPVFLEEEVELRSEVRETVQKLIQKTKQLTTSNDVYDFVKNDIYIQIEDLNSYLKGTSQ